jgi:hypothetical protein
LHNEAIKCTESYRNKVIYNEKLFYTKEEIKLSIKIQDYEIKLPNSGAELIEWADALHNCMVSYFDTIQDKETIIYGFFKDDELKFAVEIFDNSLIQASGKYNKELEDEEQKILTVWMKRFLINKISEIAA